MCARVLARLEATRAAPAALDLEAARLEQVARERLEDLRALLNGTPAEARQALGEIFGGALEFRPVRGTDGPRYEIRGSARTSVLCTKVNVPKEVVAPLRGETAALRVPSRSRWLMRRPGRPSLLAPIAGGAGRGPSCDEHPHLRS